MPSVNLVSMSPVI